MAYQRRPDVHSTSTELDYIIVKRYKIENMHFYSQCACSHNWIKRNGISMNLMLVDMQWSIAVAITQISYT